MTEPVMLVLIAEAIVIVIFFGSRIRYWQDRAMKAEVLAQHWESQTRAAWKTLADLPQAVRFSKLWKKCAKYQYQYSKFLEKAMDAQNP